MQSSPNPAPDPTRATALALLRGVLGKHLALETVLAGCAAEGRDRAAGHRLAACVLRRLGSLDAVLEPWLRRAPPDDVRHILRLGAAGVLLLGTPAHAAVATAVALARAEGLAGFSGLVNAVLRRVAEAGPAALEALDSPRLDTPPWLWRSWGAAARAIAVAHQQEAAIDLTLAPGAAVPEGAEMLPTGSVRVAAGTRVASIAGYEAGAFWVQDMAATLPARLLGVRPGERVADLCAAPGGKTAQLASAGAAVTAVERDAGRIGRLAENLRRLRLTADLVQADVLEWRPEGLFDAVLLDAPCSATGTMRRHPDVAYLKRERDLPFLADAQAQLLAHARTLLRPGGRVVYAVCSLQPEEGEQQAAAAAAAGWQAQPFTVAELADLPAARTPEGWLRTHPGLAPGMDGFFAMRLVRAG